MARRLVRIAAASAAHAGKPLPKMENRDAELADQKTRCRWRVKLNFARLVRSTLLRIPRRAFQDQSRRASLFPPFPQYMPVAVTMKHDFRLRLRLRAHLDTASGRFECRPIGRPHDQDRRIVDRSLRIHRLKSIPAGGKQLLAHLKRKSNVYEESTAPASMPPRNGGRRHCRSRCQPHALRHHFPLCSPRPAAPRSPVHSISVGALSERSALCSKMGIATIDGG